MGSSGSKAASSCGSSPTSSSSGSLWNRSKGSRGFQSYCLGTTSGSRDNDNDNDDQACDQNKVNGCNDTCTNRNEIDSDETKTESFGKIMSKKSIERSCMPFDEYGQTSLHTAAPRTGSSSTRGSSIESLNPSSRSLSRFSLTPGNISFRLSRTTSLGSSKHCHVSSSSFSMSNNDDELHLHPGTTGSLVNRNVTRHCSDLLPASSNRMPADTSNNSRSNGLASVSSGDSLNNPTVSHIQDVVRDGGGARRGLDVSLYSPRLQCGKENIETRNIDQRNGAREPVERNLQFSRTLSVGRLRDRVLRRSSLSEFSFCPLQQEREGRDASQRQAGKADSRISPSDSNAVSSSSTSGYPPSIMSSSFFSIQDYEVEPSRSREARYQDLLQHRSNFLERRRRLRSQVRALQRLGSRFENLSSHDRSCTLSGQHRNGRCTCRVSSRGCNLNNDTNARASISRIVMLAEALFEVLDEIHQQSVVLSSDPSVPYIGSVPAPTEVVESLPVKLYTKLHKRQEDAAQCHICLVEYEDGDSLRVLPCHHEFHRTCIDKWLKEIHRVCPLCRGDICMSGSLPTEYSSGRPLSSISCDFGAALRGLSRFPSKLMRLTIRSAFPFCCCHCCCR